MLAIQNTCGPSCCQDGPEGDAAFEFAANNHNFNSDNGPGPWVVATLDQFDDASGANYGAGLWDAAPCPRTNILDPTNPKTCDPATCTSAPRYPGNTYGCYRCDEVGRVGYLFAETTDSPSQHGELNLISLQRDETDSYAACAYLATLKVLSSLPRSVEFVTIVTGEVADFSSSAYNASLVALLAAQDVLPVDLAIGVASASLRITARITTTSPSAAHMVVSALNSRSRGSLSSALGVSVISAEPAFVTLSPADLANFAETGGSARASSRGRSASFAMRTTGAIVISVLVACGLVCAAYHQSVHRRRVTKNGQVFAGVDRNAKQRTRELDAPPAAATHVQAQRADLMSSLGTLDHIEDPVPSLTHEVEMRSGTTSMHGEDKVAIHHCERLEGTKSRATHVREVDIGRDTNGVVEAQQQWVLIEMARAEEAARCFEMDAA